MSINTTLNTTEWIKTKQNEQQTREQTSLRHAQEHENSKLYTKAYIKLIFLCSIICLFIGARLLFVHFIPIGTPVWNIIFIITMIYLIISILNHILDIQKRDPNDYTRLNTSQLSLTHDSPNPTEQTD